MPAPEYSQALSLILVSVILVIATIVQINTIGHPEPDDEKK